MTPTRLHVVLEPRSGHALQDILTALEEAGATAIDPIGAKFVSAEIHPDSLASLDRIAFIETKKPLGQA